VFQGSRIQNQVSTPHQTKVEKNVKKVKEGKMRAGFSGKCPGGGN